jgi:hypothetical protein
MPFASGGVRKLRGVFPQIDIYDLIERLVPKSYERFLFINARRYWLLGLCR